jgi:EAL domain-containing protein (putative c-di-GMP-specific phosphodiesterase class I)/ActR/RegA family two-component response regulator
VSSETLIVSDRSWEADSRPHAKRFPRLLLVDDDTHIMELHRRMLRRMGYAQLTCAASAQEALLQLDHDPGAAEIIICDLRMPGMDGLEFLRLLNVSPFRGSVILLSGTSIRVMHSIQKLLGRGQLTILGALSKPVSREALQDLLETWRLRTAGTAISAQPNLTAEDVALATRQEHWTLHYQPQVSLKTGELVGLEALVRCQDPEHGLIYPDRFIPVAERSGAIDALTDWIIQTALTQVACWHTGGLAIRIALNLSLRTLDAPGFWRRLTATARECGVASTDVTLELTENRVATPSDAALENLIRLELEGFTLSIDDFGTGHSSLAQLRDIPFSELKIDSGFVQGSRHNRIIRPILEGSLAIARRLQMRSVAEGIETASDWQSLRELECDVAQGYLIARPMSADRVTSWLPIWLEVKKLLAPE